MLFAARSAVALYRLLDVLPALAGDDRVTRRFTLVPGSDFGADALTAIEETGARTVPWDTATRTEYDLVVVASPKGELGRLRGPQVLLPHGAGFNKSLPYEGSGPDSASGLDPLYLARSGDAAPIALHALAHPDQVARLTRVAPRAARSAKVVGDPTLERVLASRAHRDRYRSALGTGPRTLLALTSTWGPESLLCRRPDLPAELAAQLPHDEYQLALVVHPNEWSRLGSFELTQRLEPALAAGLLLPRPRDEWASVLVAADALITDHGSAALYYAAADDTRPVVAACRGGAELLTGSPMGVLLGGVPELGPADDVAKALRAYRPGPAASAAGAAFAHRHDALRRLRAELYTLLDLTPPAARPAPVAAPLPLPRPPTRTPNSFDVQAEFTESGDGVVVARRPAGAGPPGHHLAVELGAASEQLARSAGLLYRRPQAPPRDGGPGLTWTFDGWARDTLSAYPGCRTVAAVLPSPSGRCLLRVRGHDRPYVLEAGPVVREDGRVARVDPAAAVSAAHAWLTKTETKTPTAPEPRLTCVIGARAFPLHVRHATDNEAQQEI
ncbi:MULTISPECIES: translation initiation factor 2 [unclassified Streptomyces]|uniref:translation initiation factor 2 n=1 Tax=unclassified Streptomyces TaxID=2593676 RepID=UPI00278BB5FF|nr:MULTISPECIES: translation initiation factor 2 [unclassified Streptomyces]